jgi:hypothetical protein
VLSIRNDFFRIWTRIRVRHDFYIIVDDSFKILLLLFIVLTECVASVGPHKSVHFFLCLSEKIFFRVFF